MVSIWKHLRDLARRRASNAGGVRQLCSYCGHSIPRSGSDEIIYVIDSDVSSAGFLVFCSKECQHRYWHC